MKVIYQKIIKRKDLQENPHFYYLFGDNCEREGMGGQAGEMRGEPNAIGIATKFAPGGNKADFFTDKKFDEIKEIIDKDLLKVPRGNVTIVIPKDGLGTGLAELPKAAPKVYRYLCEQLKKFETMPDFVKGYKAFNEDMKCRGFQFEEGQEYKHNEKLEMCASGFHFSEKANDVFAGHGYDFRNKKLIFREVESRGIVYGHEKNDKCVTDRIFIGRKLEQYEVLEAVNEGHYNTGRGNTGDLNTGDLNTGYLNTGDLNTGDLNTGYRNTGDCNATNYSSGVFNTEEEKIRIFNKPSNWTLQDWKNSAACNILNAYFETTKWVYDEKIQPQEGKLEVIKYKKAWENMWNILSDEQKNEFFKLPNFDKKVFKKITGIDIK